MIDRRGRRPGRDVRDWIPWRWPVDMAATIQEAGSCAFAITVVDLSATGCRLWAGFRLAPGRSVRITMEDFAPLRGRIVWSEDWYAAINFDQQIHLSVLTHLVSRHPPLPAAIGGPAATTAEPNPGPSSLSDRPVRAYLGAGRAGDDMMTALNDLAAQGQAVWLDFVDRKFLDAGGLQALVDDDGLTGVTSNPSIFEKAIGYGDAYDAALAAFDRANPDAPAMARYEHLAIQDIQAAADTLRPVYDRLDARDGYVSLEVSPYLAADTDATIAEAAKLWAAADRPNLMIKIPGTPQGVPAIAATIDAGINVNVTLLFSIDAYKAVALAYVAGLEKRVARGAAVDRIASVASFFVSRIDSKIDDAIDAGTGGAEAGALKGKVAIANAKLAYAWYQDFIASERWQALAAKGAMPQRLLWASTGTKNPGYSDVLYLDTLIGRDTVNTVPPKTLDAFRDHGTVAATLADNVDAARHVLAETERLGLNLDGVTATLVAEGVTSFAKAFDDLLGAIAAKHPATA